MNTSSGTIERSTIPKPEDMDSGGRRILCLINSAPSSRPYFENLRKHLENCGYGVSYALDSHLTDVLHSQGRTLEDGRYFTDYLCDRLDSGHLLDRSSTRHTWEDFLPDFDRFLTMNIRPPLQDNSEVNYKDIPILLDEYFDKVFAEVRPTAVLYEMVSNAFAVAAYRKATQYGIPFCSLAPSRLPGRIELSMTGGLDEVGEVGKIFHCHEPGAISFESKSIADDYLKNIDELVPDYMRTNGEDRLNVLTKYFKVPKILSFLRGLHYDFKYRRDCSLAFQHGSTLRLSIAFVKRSIKRLIRSWVVGRYYNSSIPEGRFILYPIHFHPEASTSVWAPDSLDELSTIRSIAFKLPLGVKLFVKEHPSAVGLQRVDFYEQLSHMPNVVLLSAGVQTKVLIRRSLGVVCVTSTVGFEAASLGKPVVTLGNVFYGYFPNVKRISGMTELPKALRWMIDMPVSSGETLRDAVAAYVEYGAPGNFDYANWGDDAALSSVARLVHRNLMRRSASSVVRAA